MQSLSRHLDKAQTQSDDVFLLRPLTDNLFLSKDVKLDLCPIFNIQKNVLQSVIPKFKLDSNPMEPAFIVEYEDDRSTETDLKETTVKSNNLIEIQLNSIQRKVQFIAEPFPRHKFCNVCKKKFLDYLEHINHPSHKQNLKGVKSIRYIEELSKAYEVKPQSVMDRLCLRRTVSLDTEFIQKRVRISCFEQVQSHIHKKRNIQTYSTKQQKTLLLNPSMFEVNSPFVIEDVFDDLF